METAPLLLNKKSQKYQELVLKEKGHWKIDIHSKYFGWEPGSICGLGRCEFCGHFSKNGYAIISDDGRTMKVGTDCVFTLCNLNKKQQNILKYSQARYRQRVKYADVLKYLRTKYSEYIKKVILCLKMKGTLLSTKRTEVIEL